MECCCGRVTRKEISELLCKNPQSQQHFFAAAVGLTDRIPASLWKKCSQCFRKMHFCYLRAWLSNSYYILSNSSQRSKYAISLPELKVSLTQYLSQRKLFLSASHSVMSALTWIWAEGIRALECVVLSSRWAGKQQRRQS